MARVMAQAGQDALVDVQWRTDHLASMGVRTVDRQEYLRRLEVATEGVDPWRRASRDVVSDVG